MFTRKYNKKESKYSQDTLMAASSDREYLLSNSLATPVIQLLHLYLLFLCSCFIPPIIKFFFLQNFIDVDTLIQQILFLSYQAQLIRKPLLRSFKNNYENILKCDKFLGGWILLEQLVVRVNNVLSILSMELVMNMYPFFW